jgi:hypothetical protein
VSDGVRHVPRASSHANHIPDPIVSGDFILN